MSDKTNILDFCDIYHEQNGDDYLCTCPWCDREEKLSVAVEIPHQFQCYSCKQTGNAYTILQHYYERIPALRKSQGEYLAELKPGPSGRCYFNLGVKKSSRGYIWPVRNNEGHVVAMYRYSEKAGHWISCPKPCSLTIMGLEKLKKTGPIYICEGHWDYATFLTHVDPKGLSVLGLCGSGWPSKHLSWLADRPVVFLADNDEAGQNGVYSLARNMKKRSILPQSLRYLNWSSVTLPDGSSPSDKFDIRDLYNSYEGTF